MDGHGAKSVVGMKIRALKTIFLFSHLYQSFKTHLQTLHCSNSSQGKQVEQQATLQAALVRTQGCCLEEGKEMRVLFL